MLDQEQIDIIRENFKDEDKEIKLSDEVLSLAVEKYGLEKFDGLSFEDQAKFIEQAENAVAKVSISDPTITNFVKKIDDEFHKEIKACIEATVKQKTTAIDIYAQMKRVFTLEELSSFPVPNTEAGQVFGNQKPDKTKTVDQTGKPITIVWTNDFVGAFPEAKAAEQAIDDATKELKTKGSVPALANKSKKDLFDIKRTATQERNALRAMVKRAIAFHHQWEAINAMPKVGAMFQKGTTSDKFIPVPDRFGTGELGKTPIRVTKGPRPIWMFPKDDPTEGSDFSVTQLLAFDVPAAVAAGGTMADLVATAARGAGNGGDDEGTGEDMSLEQAQESLSSVVSFLNKRENMAIIRKIVSDKKHPDRDDVLDNIGTLYLLLKPIYDANKTAYDNLQNKEDETPKDRQVA